jgi:CheY-like chemotaxis protein
MGHSVASLTGMFDSLLDLSRIEAGAVEPVPGAVHLASLLVPLIEEHRPEAEQRGLRLALRCAEQARQLCIHSDPVLLDNLLRNLIGNALKYTPRGGVLVALRRRHGSAGGDRWRLQVIDTGLGIGAADRARIFEAFYQVHNPGRSPARGLGLGLSIVQRLSVLLNHPLHLASTPGQGSCFGIEFDAVASEAAQTPGNPLPSRPRPGLRLAVAEDDDETRRALVALLEALGCEVLDAPSGDLLMQRLAALTGPWPDALITDYRMPGQLDGLGLARRWRAQLGDEAPVLVLSAEVRVPALVAGTAWFGKPVQEDRLRDWLGRL